MNSEPLRTTLRKAVNMRAAALRGGRSHRSDESSLRAYMGMAEVFLHGYPYATDEMVVEWCRAHRGKVAVIVPGNQVEMFMRLVNEGVDRVAILDG